MITRAEQSGRQDSPPHMDTEDAAERLATLRAERVALQVKIQADLRLLIQKRNAHESMGWATVTIEVLKEQVTLASRAAVRVENEIQALDLAISSMKALRTVLPVLAEQYEAADSLQRCGDYEEHVVLTDEGKADLKAARDLALNTLGLVIR